MASIQKRVSKDGKVSYRAQVRLRGQPPQTATFTRKTDARNWANRLVSNIRDGIPNNLQSIRDAIPGLRHTSGTILLGKPGALA